MTIKVVVTGAYSTGKTTLVCDLALAIGRAGFSCEVLQDISRSCPLPLNVDQTDDTTLWLIGSQVAAEIAAMSGSPDVILCDRGIPDILAHHLDVLTRRSEERVELLRPFLLQWLDTYDLLLLSRVNEAVPIEADGLRNTSPAYRTLLDGYAAMVTQGLGAAAELPFGEPARIEMSFHAVLRLLISSPERPR